MIKPTGVSHVAMVTADLHRYRAFYEDIIGLDTALVLAPSPDLGRHAIFFAGDAVLHVFEIAGYDPAAHGIGSTMFERGRLDHLGFTVPDETALGEVRDRLVAAGAASGDIRPLGPVLSVRYQDPDGFEGEINCFNPEHGQRDATGFEADSVEICGAAATRTPANRSPTQEFEAATPLSALADTATGAKPELAMQGARRKTAITPSNCDGGTAGASSNKAACVLLGRVASAVVR